jgi:hypothetical protein
MTTQEPTGPVQVPMAAGDGGGAARPAGASDVEEIRADIDRTRAELGDSVEALAGKANVKARAGQAARTAATRAQDKLTAGRRLVRQRAGTLASTTGGAAQRVRTAAPQRVRQVGETVRRRPVPIARAGAGVAAAVATAALIARRRAATRVNRASEPGKLRPEMGLDRPRADATIEALAASGDVKTLAGLAARAAMIRAADILTAAAYVVRQRAGQLVSVTADAAQRTKAVPPPQARQAARTARRRSRPVSWSAGAAALVATAVLIRRRRAAKAAAAGEGITGAVAAADNVQLHQPAADIRASRTDLGDST